MATLTTSWQKLAEGTQAINSDVSANTRLYLKYGNRNVSENKDTIYWEIRAVATPDASWAKYGYGYDESYSLKDGNTTRASGTYREGSYPSDLITNVERTLASGNWSQSHNSDGNWSTTLTFSASVYGTSYSRSISVSLPQIPRQATLTSAPDFNDEENPTIKYSNPAGNSVNSLQACIANTAGNTIYVPYRDVNKTGTLSYTFNLTSAERTTLRQACTSNSMALKFYLKTVIGSNTYYSSIQKTMTIVNGNPTFSDFTFADTNSTTVALTGNNQNIIKNYSNVTATISTSNKATANKEATMSKYRFSCGTNTPVDINYSSSSSVSGTINSVTDGVFTMYAIDSRGNSTPVIKQANSIIDYSEIIKGNISASRSNGVSETTTLSFSGTWWNDNFGNASNSITAEYKYKKTSDSSFPVTSTPLTLTVSNNNFSFSGLIAGDEGANGFNINYSYDIQVIVTDELSTATFTVQLSSGIPHIAYAQSGVSIMGKYNDSVGGLLQVGGQRIDNADSLPIGSVIEYDGNTVPSGYQAVDDFTEYSTTEKVVGKWIDGKPLYQKTFSGNLTLGSGTTISDLTPLNYDFVSFYDVTFTKIQTSNSTRYWFPVFYESSTDYARIYIRESDRLLIAVVKGSAVNELKAYVTLRYTKTTD